MRLSESELILHQDGSVYHLNLRPEDIAPTVILVGDPDRVAKISRYFDSIELKKQKREFVTHTGYLKHQRFSVISTGISTDNIDIVLNELDALVNIDFTTRLPKPESQLRSLSIIRIGTAGGLQADLPLDSFLLSERAIGLDGLANFYPLVLNAEELLLMQNFANIFPDISNYYAVTAGQSLMKLFLWHRSNMATDRLSQGITVTCPGFYGPQGRMLRIEPKIRNFTQRLTQLGISNFEMETAGIYAMGRLLNHQCCSLSAIVADRVTGRFSDKAEDAVDNLIRFVLDVLTA